MMPTDAMSWLVWVMVAGLLILLWASALLLARTVLPGRPRRARDENEAIGELSLRLARGEITADEFEQQRQLGRVSQDCRHRGSDSVRAIS